MFARSAQARHGRVHPPFYAAGDGHFEDEPMTEPDDAAERARAELRSRQREIDRERAYEQARRLRERELWIEERPVLEALSRAGCDVRSLRALAEEARLDPRAVVVLREALRGDHDAEVLDTIRALLGAHAS